MIKNGGGFTIPGENGFEDLTLELAKKWGADAIRDSDGTSLPPKLSKSGYDIYSTVCIIRDHNEWIKQNLNMQQQTFLITNPVVANAGTLSIGLLDDFFKFHVSVNESPESLALWQVYDRTASEVLPTNAWVYSDGIVKIKNPAPWHSYTVSFLAFRIWEEISMYNHTTNGWNSEHLMQLDPVFPEVRAYLLDWMDTWCREHPDTRVVRFTSLFYNFTWIWGQDERLRNIFTDWGSYAFAASPLMLKNFEKAYGYALNAEDFVNGGKYRTTHMSPDSKLRDFMDFVCEFVAGFAKELVDVVHSHGKEAYVFYDDCWIGLEPYGKRFASIGFDGLIKCVFSGFEVRLCSHVSGVETKEIRLHPYLFPVGLGGLPTFSKGGNPARDAMEYWVSVRRALLRSPIDRIGLGGYLSLTEDFPEFNEAITVIADEFRTIRDLHSEGAPERLEPTVGILTAWGALRSWTCCGHYHENPDNDLLNLIESLSGLAFDVRFLDFNDVRDSVPDGIDILINAGFAGSSWSGGDEWLDEHVVSSLTKWVSEGGAFLGVGAPSAVRGFNTFFRLAHVLGVDIDTGARVNHGKWSFELAGDVIKFESMLPTHGLYLTNGDTLVLGLAEGDDSMPVFTENTLESGTGVYLSSYRHSFKNAHSLGRLLSKMSGFSDSKWFCPDSRVECTIFPSSGKAVIVNNSPQELEDVLAILNDSPAKISLKPYAMMIL